jgi:hypothetical protein
LFCLAAVPLAKAQLRLLLELLLLVSDELAKNTDVLGLVLQEVEAVHAAESELKEIVIKALF